MPGLEISFDSYTAVVGPEGGMGFTITPAVIRFEGPDGEMVEQSVRDLHIWRRDADGKWKVVVDMWNSPTPLPGMEP